MVGAGVGLSAAYHSRLDLSGLPAQAAGKVGRRMVQRLAARAVPARVGSRATPPRLDRQDRAVGGMWTPSPAWRSWPLPRAPGTRRHRSGGVIPGARLSDSCAARAASAAARVALVGRRGLGVVAGAAWRTRPGVGTDCARSAGSGGVIAVEGGAMRWLLGCGTLLAVAVALFAVPTRLEGPMLVRISPGHGLALVDVIALAPLLGGVALLFGGLWRGRERWTRR
jgi:hypothetical protein